MSKTLTALTSATTPLAGTEEVYVVQGGNSRMTTAAAFYIPGGTDVAIADGGTGSSTASGARTNLGVAIGTDVQAYDADLTSWAGVTRATGFDTFTATPSSANLLALLTTKTGTGSAVFSISAALTGTPTAPTAAVDTNTTQIATTAMVLAQAAAATPLGNLPTAAVGASTRFARADHVHPGREVLTASRTYYVLASGSDSNTGLVNTAGGAFLTIQKAIDTAAALDLSVYSVTIQVGAGTWTPTIIPKSYIGSGPVTLQGDTGTPSNVLISTTSANCIDANGVRGKYVATGFKFATTTSGYAIAAANGTQIDLGVVEFGACATGHVDAEQGAVVALTSNYTISGGSTRHWFSSTGALIACVGRTVTLTGTPAFSSGFLIASRGGGALISSNTFSGAATGTRYIVTFNAWADVAGGGASYLPGNAAGSTATGGQYA